LIVHTLSHYKTHASKATELIQTTHHKRKITCNNIEFYIWISKNNVRKINYVASNWYPYTGALKGTCLFERVDQQDITEEIVKQIISKNSKFYVILYHLIIFLGIPILYIVLIVCLFVFKLFKIK